MKQSDLEECWQFILAKLNRTKGLPGSISEETQKELNDSLRVVKSKVETLESDVSFLSVRSK